MARKSKGFGESIKPEEENKNLEQPKQRVKKSAFGELLEDKEFNPNSKENMSDIFKEFIAPYTKFRAIFEQYDKFLSLAVAAWNFSLFPADKRQFLIDELIDKLGEGMKHEIEIEEVLKIQKVFRELIEKLIDRRRSDYSDYNRYIVKWNLQKAGGEYHISVVSTPIEEFLKTTI